jgi:hypothetical protein
MFRDQKKLPSVDRVDLPFQRMLSELAVKFT